MVRNFFFNRNRQVEPQPTGPVSSPSPHEFGSIATQLQQTLQQWVAQPNRLQIRCAIREGTLLVLIEHLLHVEPEPQQIFLEVEQTVRSDVPKLIEIDPGCSPTLHSRPIPVRLYLRIAGYQQPYDTRSFTLTPLYNAAQAESAAPSHNTPSHNTPIVVQEFVVQESLTESPIVAVEPAIPLAEPTPPPKPLVEMAWTTPTPEAVRPEAEEIEEGQDGADERDTGDGEDGEDRKEIEHEANDRIASSTDVQPPPLERSDELPNPPVPFPSLNFASTETWNDQISDRETEPEILARTEFEQEDEQIEENQTENLIAPDLEANIELNEENSKPIDAPSSYSVEELTAEEILTVSDISEDASLQTDEAPVEPIHFEQNPPENDTPELFSESSAPSELELDRSSGLNQVDSAQPDLNQPNLNQLSQESLAPENLEQESLEQESLEQESLEQVEQAEQSQTKNEKVEEGEVITDESFYQPIRSLDALDSIPAQFERNGHSPNDDRPYIINQEQSVTNRETESITVVDQNQTKQLPVLADATPNVQKPAELGFDRLPLEIDDGKNRSFRSKLTLSNVLLTGAVGLFVVVSGVYALSRPCVLGNQCVPLQRSQQLTQRALTLIQSNPSALEVVDAYDQLTQANQLLETIPFWSRSYTIAQAMMADYANEIEELGLVVKALNQANNATKKSLNPPHPIQVWREVQWMWREAIALLEKVPSESLVYALAQNKRSEYQSNLASINNRVLVEQEAQDRIAVIKQAAEVTEARSQIINSIDSWQQTAESWQTILNQLQQIPQGTMAHAESQRLARLYQLRLEEAENRRSQEERSASLYNQALSLADQARRFEQQEQWPQAADTWRNAITTIKQVPEGTTHYSQAQTLLAPYTSSLNQAESSSKRSSLLQTAQPQLQNLCLPRLELCTYTLTTEAIRVQLAARYDRTVSQALRTAQLSGSNALLNDPGSQTSRFLQSLANISESTQTPIELYNADGSRFGTYDPNQSGFIVQ